MKVKAQYDYAKARREAYPPLEEQLDAIFKGGTAEDEMRRKIMEVKEKFPKDKK